MSARYGRPKSGSTRERAEAEAAASQSNEARGKLDGLAARTGELERQLLVQTTEAEVLSRRAQRAGKPARRSGPAFGRARVRGHPAARRTRSGRQDRDTICAKSLRMPAAAAAAPSTNSAPISASLKRSSPPRRRAHQAAARDRDHEARRGNDLGGRARRERAAARAHQRCRRRGGAAHRGARRPRLADRVDAGRGGSRPGGEASATARPSTAASQTGGATLDAPQENKGTLADRIRALQSGASRAASN